MVVCHDSELNNKLKNGETGGKRVINSLPLSFPSTFKMVVNDSPLCEKSKVPTDV